MGVIRVLDAAVADQIAAGEVVERPASVVKELLENAVDAGATEVSVHVDGGGLTRIRVVDNGRGMAPDDAVLCFSRHATSKITRADDLIGVRSFGFRGEALAALSSVARVRLVTRTADAEVASEVGVDGGRVTHVGDAGAPRGTRVDVDDLFYNVPARRKFLKAPRTEAGHVEDVVAEMALSLPHVALSLTLDQKPALDLAAVPSADGVTVPLHHPQRIERVVQCLGKHVRPLLFPFEAKTELLQVTGYVVAPLETRRDLSGVHLSVNGRPVSDRGLTGAVRTAFRTLLEVGRQPIVALDIGIDGALVDVNVHPRKAEVRFVDPRRVHGHLIAVLSEFLASTPWLKGQATPYARTMTLAARDGSAHPQAAPASVADDEVLSSYRARLQQALQRYDARTQGRAAPAVAFKPAPLVDASLPLVGVGGSGTFSALRVVGQVSGTFLVLEGADGMVVIDQHAAHERVVFERLKAARSTSEAPTQPLLIPLQLELSTSEMGALDDLDAQRALSRHGLVVEPFGPRQALVKAIPAGLDARQAEQIARDALKEASAGGHGTLTERDDAVCARLACHAAVRAGDALGGDAIRALLRDLDAIDLGAHCPHGRPVARTVPFEELAGWFDRT